MLLIWRPFLSFLDVLSRHASCALHLNPLLLVGVCTVFTPHCYFLTGRSYSISSQRMLMQCLESLVQKCQSGVVINFEKIGPDPPPLNEGIAITNRSNPLPFVISIILWVFNFCWYISTPVELECFRVMSISLMFLLGGNNDIYFWYRIIIIELKMIAFSS